ncbi:MAG: hypothetical protein QOI48_3073 [Solirubrobacteraceae bacterium]|jgi:hypothetical protein|nr:hypothetical protein [Solirubrobacteraceae bacterium]
MSDRVFVSYQDIDRAVLDDVARLLVEVGFGISGRDFTRDELFVVGSPLQQLQAATVAIVLVTTAAADSAAVAREIEWAIEQNKGIVGLRLDADAAMPHSLYAAGAELLDISSARDLAYLPGAIDAAARSAKLLELAASRGSGSGAPCHRPTGPR